MVKKMWEDNPHGGGVAWRKDGKVHWQKGLSLEEMQDRCKNLPMPYVAHFRVASVGGIRPILTHPFAVEDFDKSLALEGETEGSVIFHNGHWGEWRNFTLQTACEFGMKLPDGRWSDSRAMAWLAGLYGYSLLEILDQKIALMSPTSLEFILGTDGWVKVDGLWCSNDRFDRRYFHQGGFGNTYHICRFGRCTENKDLDTDGHCRLHSNKPSIAPPAKVSGTVVDINQSKKKDVSLSPLALRQKLTQAELQHQLVKDGVLKRADLTISKNELKRLRRSVAALGSQPAVAH